MNRILNLKRRVMARIYFEYTKSVLVNHPDYFMLAIFIIVSFVSISIHDVLINVPKNNLSGALSFFLIALRDTSWIIQILIAGFFVRVIVTGSVLAYKNLNFKNRFFYSNV